MKKIVYCLLSVLVVTFSACGSKSKKAENKEEIKAITEEIQQKVAALAEDYAKLDLPDIFLPGTVIDDKELTVKPDYFYPLSTSNDLQTLSQKYRAMGIYSVDYMLAKKFNINNEQYKQVLGKLGADINFKVVKTDSEEITPLDADLLMEKFNLLLEEDVPYLYFELTTSALVEMIYLCNQTPEIFSLYFTDEDAADFTKKFAACIEAIDSMKEYYPEMNALNMAIEPLKKIKANTAEEFYNQLKTLQNEILTSRAALL